MLTKTKSFFAKIWYWFTRKPIFVNKKAFLIIMLVTAIATAWFTGWANASQDVAVTEVSFATAKEDNRSIKEHVFDLLINECEIPFDDVVKAMAMIERCENPHWDEFAWNINKPTKGCSRGSMDWGIWMINDCYQLSNFDSKSDLVRCATDTYCATRYACKLYRDWGNSWEAWSCNR